MFCSDFNGIDVMIAKIYIVEAFVDYTFDVWHGVWVA